MQTLKIATQKQIKKLKDRLQQDGYLTYEQVKKLNRMYRILRATGVRVY